MNMKLQSCYQQIRDKTDFEPKIALILGSGLGTLANEIEIVCTVDFTEIEGFPHSTVEGHVGRYVFGYIEDVAVVIMQGRVHYYEGYDMHDVVLPVRLMKLLGAKILFLTNASGGINAQFSAGDFMVITDHISSFVPSPLVGKNLEELGVRFPDMSHVYDEALVSLIKDVAKEQQIEIKTGTYVQTSGPNFETPAEIKMYRTIGADAAGMSTACEAMAGNHAGMRICGISCISNLASGMTANPLTHQEVQETANRVAPLFKRLIRSAIKAMGDL